MDEALTHDDARATTPPQPNYWREELAPYARPHVGRSLLDIATSVVPFCALWVGMYAALDVSHWLTLALSVPAAGFLLRTFIVFHDCTHGSFLPSRRANAWVGSVCGLLGFTPFAHWRHEHAVHHGSAGDLDRRGTGDVTTLTVAEYAAMSSRGRLGYRLFRNPLVMFGLGPLYSLVIVPRMVRPGMRPRLRRSVIATNVALAVVIGALVWAVGWQAFLFIETPIMLLAGGAGVFLFYVQHQFEDVYWESADRWTYAEAALRGSSYLRLPQPLRFFTGNIGLHHVHHLSARIPNYNLKRAHDENEIFHDVPVLSLWDGIKATRLKLFDEDSRSLITWGELRRRRMANAGGAAAALR